MSTNARERMSAVQMLTVTILLATTIVFAKVAIEATERIVRVCVIKYKYY